MAWKVSEYHDTESLFDHSVSANGSCRSFLGLLHHPRLHPAFLRARARNQRLKVTSTRASGAEFHVPRQLLAEASPLMENWTAPSPGRKDPVSIIELPTGEMVETLLRLCHPLAPAPHFPTLDAMKGALTLGWEYELRGGARDRVARALEPWLETEPVRLYVFAVEEDKLELMAVAARASLRLAGTLADHEELDAISTRAYRRLLTYRGACAAKMADIASYGAVDDRKWVWRTCGCSAWKPRCLAPWFARVYASLGVANDATSGHCEIDEGQWNGGCPQGSRAVQLKG